MKLSSMPTTRLLFVFSAVLALAVRVRAFLLPSTALRSEVGTAVTRYQPKGVDILLCPGCHVM